MEKNRKLKARIIEKYGTQREFLKVSPLKKNKFFSRMKGRTEFQVEEVKEICELLEIPNSKVTDYFF